jgi:hypothetical protein
MRSICTHSQRHDFYSPIESIVGNQAFCNKLTARMDVQSVVACHADEPTDVGLGDCSNLTTIIRCPLKTTSPHDSNQTTNPS